MDLNGERFRVEADEALGWKNATLICSKLRESTREITVLPYYDYYPKLVMTLGLKAMFSTQFVIGSGKSLFTF